MRQEQTNSYSRGIIREVIPRPSAPYFKSAPPWAAQLQPAADEPRWALRPPTSRKLRLGKWGAPHPWPGERSEGPRTPGACFPGAGGGCAERPAETVLVFSFPFFRRIQDP